MLDLYYPSLERVIRIHDEVIKTSGGKTGIKDEGSIDSILCHIQNDDYYKNIFEKATHLCFQINKGHCFIDGNKRTSLAITLEFLNKNSIFPIRFFEFMENIAVAVADNIISKELLYEILVALILDDIDNKEWLKLEIYHSLLKLYKKMYEDK